MIESLSLDSGTGSIVIVYEGGATQELRRCPFSGCHLYHSILLVKTCPTTGKSITEELRRQEDAAKVSKKEILAEEARDKYLAGHKYLWHLCLTIIGAIVIFVALVHFPVFGFPAIEATMASVAFYVCMLFWERKRRQRTKKEAEEVYQRVLFGPSWEFGK